MLLEPIFGKLASDMEKYELTIVLPAKSTAAKKKSAQDLVTKLLDVFKGKVTSSNDWGELDLAYKVKKNLSGVFLYFELELDRSKAPSLGEKLKLEESIIRHLLLRKE